MKYKFKVGEKPVITVDLPQTTVGQQIRRGEIDPYIEPEYPGRRLSSGIRLFDMGYWLIGLAYETLPYVDPQRDDPFTTSGGSLTNVAGISLTNYTDRDDIIFGISQDQWASKFRLVDAAYANVVSAQITWNDVTYSLASSPPEWNDGVFTPPGAPGTGFNASINNSYAWNAYLKTDSTYKITAVRDYSSASVPFTPASSMDVFMFPSFMQMANSVEIGRLILGVANFDREFFGYAHVIRSREVIHDPSDPYYGLTIDGDSWDVGGSSGDYTDVYEQVRYYQDVYADYRAIRQEQVGGVYNYFALDDADFAGASDWPAPPTLPTIGLNTSYRLLSEANLRTLVPGALVCVVKQGGAFYYVWAT